MVTTTRAQSQRPQNGSSSAGTMSNQNVTTVQPEISGRIIDSNEEVFTPSAGNNPAEESSSSDDNDDAAYSQGSTSSEELDTNE